MTNLRTKRFKITAALLFLCCSFILAQTNGQKVSLNLRNVSLVEVFSAIEKQTSYRFAYRNVVVDKNKDVTVSKNNASVKSVLDAILPSKGLQYFIVSDKSIVISEEKSSVAHSPSKSKQISGVIKDDKGEPILGANVTEKGTTNGVTSDLNGNFTLKVSENSELAISYIGYNSQKISVSGKNYFTILLKENSQALDEVVVVGYAVQKKVNLSGSVGVVSAEKLENRPVINLGQALQGAVANLNVSIGGGQATDSPSFNVRGTTSLNGGSPLVIIDGVASDKDQLNRMNPTDVASISVLKDAASSAIYGSRAAFGVILVTTKIGKSEKLTINYNNSFVMRKITKMPEIIANPYDVALIRNTMSYPWYTLYDEEQLAYAKKCASDPSTSPYYTKPDGTYSYFGETDWVNEACKKSGFSTAHTIDLSGKTDKLNYFFSGNYNFQDGMIKYGTDKYNRYNLRSKLDFKISDRWSISNNTSFVTVDYDAPTSLSNSYFREINRVNPMDVPRNPDGSWTKAGAEQLGRLEQGGREISNKTTIRTQFGTKIDLIKNVLFVQGNFSYSNDKNKTNGCYLPVDYYEGAKLAPRRINEVTSAYGSTSDVKHVLLDAYGTFQKTFAQKHALTLLAGFNQEEYRYDYMSLSRKELISNSLPSVNLATGDMNVSQSIQTWAIRGAFARFNYIYDDKYIMEFNGRYDGTSRFAKNSRFAFNPSGSLAWVVSKEKFFQPITNVVSFMKFRYSYGSLGNQDVSTYAYLATMGNGKISQILDGKQPVYVSAPGLVAGDLTWEKVTTSNVGLDMNFFNNRLTLSADAYIRKTKDMLTKGETLPCVLGTAVPQQNAADLETKGWELTLGWKNEVKVAGKPLNYNVNFSLADSRAYITKFENKTGSLNDYYVGKEIGEIWGANTLGFFTSNEEIKNHANQSKVTSYPGTRPLAPGDLKFEDLNNDGKIDYGKWTLEDHGDYHVIGNTRSRFTFGLSMGAEWNGFDMSLFVQGVGKKDYMPGAGDLYFWGIYAQPWTNVTKGNFIDHWTPENPNAYFPRMKSYVAEQNHLECGVPQTRYLQNAAYARLKNFTLGYTLPKQLTQKVLINRMRVFFSGDNLFEISGLYKFYKVDPEGLGGELYPLQRSYSFGLNVTF